MKRERRRDREEMSRDGVKVEGKRDTWMKGKR